jgi:hypothetical protein
MHRRVLLMAVRAGAQSATCRAGRSSYVARRSERGPRAHVGRLCWALLRPRAAARAAGGDFNVPWDNLEAAILASFLPCLADAWQVLAKGQGTCLREPVQPACFWSAQLARQEGPQRQGWLSQASLLSVAVRRRPRGTGRWTQPATPADAHRTCTRVRCGCRAHS